MKRREARAKFEADWGRWISTVGNIDPALTREPGVCGGWTIHDVVGHVQLSLRYSVSQVRAAFDHMEATEEEINGERPPFPEGTPNTQSGRNAAMRETGLHLTWQQLLDESEWLRARALAWFDARSDAEAVDPLGFVSFWDPNFPKPDDLRIHLRRLKEAPAANHPAPAYSFLHSRHLDEHLDQIEVWLRSRVSASRV